MDGKALAKSKRAHSLHHQSKTKKKNPIGIGKGKQNPQSSSHPSASRSSPALPSNWDRYHDDDDDESGDTTQQPTEFVVPKSKGGDYAHLISEAKAHHHSQANRPSSNVFPSFGDVFEDFTQDFSPLLSSKGKSLLSWIIDDNFDFEDKASATIEVPFLSLNLIALAEQLSKAKLSERLFLDPDVLPPELDDELQKYGEDDYDSQTCTSAAALDSGTDFQQYHEPVSSAITKTSETGPNPVMQISSETNLQSRENRSNSISESTVDSAAGNPPVSEAASAEAELDMLLNSFGEIKAVQSLSASAETSNRGTYMSKPGMHIDDTIDSLLKESSNLTIQPHADDIPSASLPGSKSKILDDFDSWLDTI